MSGPDQPMYQPPQAPPPGQSPMPPQSGTPGSATASLVLGIVGILLCPIICSPLAIFYGNKAKKEIRGSHGSGEGLAKAGVILGWIGIAFALLGIALIVAGVVAI